MEILAAKRNRRIERSKGIMSDNKTVSFGIVYEIDLSEITFLNKNLKIERKNNNYVDGRCR